MRTLLVATVSALALFAGQALAQSAGTTSPPSDQSAQQSPGGSSATEAPPAASGSGLPGSESSAQPTSPTDQSAAAGQDASQMPASDLLGKKVKLQGQEAAVGEITDVVMVDGKPQKAVIDMGSTRPKPVAVDLTELNQSGQDFILSMTEQELAAVPDYEPGQEPDATGATRALPGQQQPGATSDQPAGQTPGASTSQPPSQSR